MTWSPISGANVPYTEAGNQAAGYVLKFYAVGTTTPLTVASTSAGTPTTTDFLLDSEGYLTLSSARVIPHVETAYKLIMYLNQTDADADDTGSAVWTIDNITLAGSIAGLGATIAQYASNGDFFTDSGSANTVVLTTISPKTASASYVDGERIAFYPNANSTGATTVNRDGLGVKNVKTEDGSTLPSGALSTTSLFFARYYLASTEFRQEPVVDAATTKTLKSGRKNFFSNGELRTDQRDNSSAKTYSGTAVAYSLDGVYGSGVTSSSFTHKAIDNAGLNSNQKALEIADAGVNTGAVLAGFASEMTEASDDVAMVFSFNAKCTAAQDVDYDVFYADDSDLTNSTSIGSGTISLTTSYADYEVALSATTPASTNVGIFVRLKKDSAASSATYTITSFQLEAGTVATNIEWTTEDGGLKRCEWFYRQVSLSNNAILTGAGVAGNEIDSAYIHFEKMRSTPTASFDATVTNKGYTSTGSAAGTTNTTGVTARNSGVILLTSGYSGGVSQFACYTFTMNAASIIQLSSDL